MSSNGAGNLEIIEGIMKQEVYPSLLNKNLKQSSAMLKLDKGYLFHQDSSCNHKSRSTTKYLEKNKIFVLEWSHQSPDLNPFENLCNRVDRKIHKHNIKSKLYLQTRILKAWNNIDPKMIRHL